MTTQRLDAAPPPAISVVVPMFNEENGAPELYRRLKTALVGMGERHEIIFVNDGSRDRSWQVILDLANADQSVRAVNLSRNFGHQIAITAGIDFSNGLTVVVMDSDLQDPPELIPALYAKYREGFDVAYAQRRVRKGETWFKRATAKWFYRLIRRITAIDIPVDTGDFRLMSRRVVEDLKNLQERTRFVRGLVTWVGYNQAPVFYDRDRRYFGKTRFSVGKMTKFALDGVTGFSSQPLRLASHAGLLFALGSLTLLAALVLYRLTGGHDPIPASILLTLAMVFMGGVQLIAIGILGEYVGRIYEEAKRRPLYIVRDRVNIPPDADIPEGSA